MTKTTIELLDSIHHKSLRIDTTLVDVPHNHINAANVSVTELATLNHEYPIFITKNPHTGKFLFSAILGIHSGQNLYIQEGKWKANYLPLDVLRKPFQAMLEKEDSFSGGRIAIDVSSPVIGTQKGELLFDDEGKPTAYLQRIQDTFGQLMGSIKATEDVLDGLYKHDLLEAVTLEFDLGNGNVEKMNGLYAINKKVLSSLTGVALEECHKAGLLEVCHLVMSSGAHVQKLIQWAREV